MPLFRNIRTRLSLTLLPLLAAAALSGQTTGPILLPYTISTIAGGGAATTAGTACPTAPALKATDAYGDGCPASAAIFSSDIRGGVAVDPLGNVYLADTANSQVRRIDPRSGLITTFAGGNKICTGTAVDKNGDGCVASTSTVLNSPRGIGSDVYGNIFIAGYSDNLVHLVCEAISPLCSAAQLGVMRVIAGCTTTTTAYGSSGNTGDGLTGAGVCSASTVATVNQPRGATADRFGNMYFGDTGNSRFRVVAGPNVSGLTNPLIAILQTDPAYASVTAASAAGKMYPAIGGTQFTVPASGAACSTGSSSTALDAYGDGCPFFNTSITTTGGFVQGVATDTFGDFIFTDSQTSGRVRVLYAGGTANPMAHLITLANPTVTSPQIGFVYSIAGGGAATISSAPILAGSAALDGNLFRVTTDSYGNIFLGDNSAVLFLDINTGGLRRIAANNTVCTAADAAGDGCPATQASFSGSNSVLGLAVDNLGNLFLDDGTHLTVRKISAASFAPAPFGTGSNPSLFVHANAGTTALSTTLAPNSDFTLGAQSCSTNTFDNTYDCTIPITFTPSQIGQRDAPLAIQSTPAATTLIASLTATSTGTTLTFDPTAPATPSTQTLASTIVPASVAIDGHGNTYTVNTATKRLTQIVSATPTAIGSALTALPSQIAVDPQGSLYAATSGSASITKLAFTAPSTYTTSSLTLSALVSASAVAVDPNGTLYIADNSTGTIYKLSQTTGLATTLTASALSNPVSLALDNTGNLLIADSAAKAVYRLPTSGISTGLPATVTLPSGAIPVAVAADAAGNVYVADSGTGSVFLIPLSGVTATVATGFTAINGLAVDGLGNVYITSASSGITEILRSQYAFSFGSSLSTSLTGSVTNSGNVAAQGFAQSDIVDFQLTGTGSTCNLAATSIAAGTACTIVASFNPSGTGGGAVTDAITFLPAASTTGALTLNATKLGNVTTTTTAISNEQPQSPVYVAGGASVSFSVIVSATKGTAAGTVSVALDGGTANTYVLDATGTASVPFTGLTAGSHTLTALYPAQSGISGSTATPVTFTVAQATTSVTFQPAALTQPFSRAIGTSVFNATANGVPGAFVYTATATGGSAIAVDSSSYLPVGTYSLAVAFTPSDATDYLPSSATVASYTVTKAPTVAAFGASTSVVAADGSANFTSIAAAVAALPVTGGTIYLRPGTYSGQFNVSYPNVSLRGLGGNAQNVIITAENGAFSAPYPTGVTAASNGFAGDEGSSTVVVDKQTINGVSYTPNNFYMENLSIQNTYDTDATNANTLATVNGNCTTGQPATNNLALYNAGTLCASQALALWIRSDKAVLNNVRLTSLQDTLYAGSQGCGTTCVPARQYYWKGYITGDVDYIFGDAATVFDGTTFYTTYHGLTPTGTETIEAQNKSQKTGSSTDYLSGYILNNAILTSQGPGMTQLYFGRPYGQYSTFILLNTTVDQVNPLGWIEFSGDTNLPTSTYAEYNTQGPGGTAASLAGRETTSFRPEVLTAAQAAKYAPLTFLSTPSPDVWDPTAALAAGVNAFAPTASAVAINVAKSITILARPQTPGAGAIPTGAYTLTDGSTTLASGTLDASGSAYLTTSTLAAGVHSITFTYAGDSNFIGSSSTTPLVITVGGTQSALTITTANPTYGAPAAVSVAITQSDTSHPLTGSVALTVDSSAPITAQVSANAATFTLTSLSAGAHTLLATYSGDTYNGSSSITSSLTVAKAPLTIIAPTLSIVFGAPPAILLINYKGLVNGDTPATLTGAPSLTTTPTVPTAVGSYVITAAAGTLLTPNYTDTFVNGLLTITHAATATTLTSGNASPGTGYPTTFTASVTSTAKGTPTGVVTFYNGTAALDSITLSPTGTATLTTAFASAGSSSITAVYSGDASFSPSTSSAATETILAPGLTITAAPPTLTIATGAAGTTTLTFTPTGNYQGTASLSCTGLPADAVCSFNPTQVSFTGNNAVQTATLLIQTGVQTATNTRSRSTTLAAIFLLPLVGLLTVRRRTLPRATLLVLLLTAATLAGAIGCGSQPTTPAGTSNVIVSIAANGPSGPTTQQLSLSVTVTH